MSSEKLYACGQRTDWQPGNYIVFNTRPDSDYPKKIIALFVLHPDFSGEWYNDEGDCLLKVGPMEGPELLEDWSRWHYKRLIVTKTEDFSGVNSV